MDKTDFENKDIAQIKRMSEELSIPFPNILSGYFLEYVFEIFVKADWQGILWFKNLYNLGIASYSDGIQDHLVFYLVSENITFYLPEKIDQIFQELDEENVFFLWKITDQEPVQVDISIKWERFHIPLKIQIVTLETSEIFPDEKIFVSSFERDKEILYLALPADIQLAENVIEIFDKLELVNDMSVYHSIYQILSSDPIEGRKIYHFFADYLREDDIKSWMKKWDVILSYKTYHHMKKKWKSYHKKFKKETLLWEEVINLLEVFFTPIWKALEEDVIFFGDWMPNLRRYLD